jgi:hypothetical protein
MTLQAIIALVIFLVVLVGLATLSIRIVREYERLIVFRLGRALGARGPGLVTSHPLCGHGRPCGPTRNLFSMLIHRPALRRTMHRSRLTFLVYMKVINAVHSVLEVEDFGGHHVVLRSRRCARW